METPSAPEELLNRLDHSLVEGDENMAAYLAAAEAAYEQLRASLSIFLGQTGFDALWARALSLVPGQTLREDALRLRSSGWTEALGARPRDHVRTVIAAAFTGFIDLLFNFVGAEIGSRLLHQAWSIAPIDKPSTSTGEGPS